MEVFARLRTAPGLCVTTSGPVALTCWEWDAKPVRTHHPFALHSGRIKGLHPAALQCRNSVQIHKGALKVGPQCLVHAWVCPLEDLCVMRGQAPTGSPKSLRKHS